MTVEIQGCSVLQTCGACPEQYDVLIGSVQIGYLRLRWGHFYAAYPDVGGEHVHEFDFGEEYKGVFEEEERLEFLTNAVTALVARHAQELGI